MDKALYKNNHELFVTGEIGYDFQAEDFIREVNFLSQSDEDINVHIYSGGGAVFDALAIYDFIKLKGIKLNVYISGLAGSAATIIAAAAGKNNTHIGENSFYFVHNAFNPYSDEPSEILDNINERLVNIYKDLTGMRKDQVKKLLKEGDDGQFLTASKAKELGFVGSIYKVEKLAASVEFYKQIIDNTMDKKEFNVEEFEKSFYNKVMDGVKEFFNKKEKEVSNEALEAAVNEVSNSVKDEVVNSFEAKSSEKETELLNKIAELEAEVNKLSAKKVDPIKDTEKNPVDDAKKVESEWDILANKIKNELPNFSGK